MADAPAVQTMTVTAPQDFKYVEGQPIQFELPVSSFDLMKFAPKEIAEKPYFKDKIKSADDLWKSLDGAQTAMGKPRYGVPAADAPQEVWDQFFASAGGENEDAYKFEENPDAPPELKSTPEFQKAIKGIFKKYGVAPRQALGIQKDFDLVMMENHKALKAQNDAVDAKFNELSEKAFPGAKRKEAFDTSKRVFEYLLPKEFHGMLGKVNNEGLVMMALLANQVKSKYLKEDELPSGTGGGGEGGSKEEVRAQAMKKQEEAMKLDTMDPKKEQLMKEARELYQRYEKM